MSRAGLASFVLDRDDDMMMTGKRHDFRVDWSVGFDARGRMEAVDLELAARCGCSADLCAGVVDRAMFHSDNAYFLPAFRIFLKRVKTNTVSNTAFRGFGGPQGVLAIERVIDAIARQLGLDPLDVRKANFYRSGGDSRLTARPWKTRTIHRLIEELERTRTIGAAGGHREVQRVLADPQARHRADAGQVRHFVHAGVAQSGWRAGSRLSGRLGASQSRRH